MILTDQDIRITINKISDAEILDTHIVYDPENFKEEEFKCILLIGIKGKTFEKTVVLYCSSIGNHERCSALHDGKLFIVMFNTAYMIHCATGEIQYLPFSGMAGAFRILSLEDGYLIHGEMEIAKIDFDLNILWIFSGADIFTYDDIDSSGRINGKNVELTDFLGNRYTVSLLTGKQI